MVTFSNDSSKLFCLSLIHLYHLHNRSQDINILSKLTKYNLFLYTFLCVLVS